MGVDCKIYLPMDVDDRALADAVGILAGLPKKLVDHSTYVSCDVNGVQTKPSHTPSMGQIILSAPSGKRLVDGEMGHEVNFHWGSRFKGQTWILLSPRSTPFWIAVGRRLIDWFGGFIVYSDYDEEKGANLSEGKRGHPMDEDGFVPHGGEAWTKYQKAASELDPVSDAELRSAWKKAAYRDQFDWSGKVIENQPT